jgi:hypothetical protein
VQPETWLMLVIGDFTEKIPRGQIDFGFYRERS